MTMEPRDILITGGRVYTADPRQPWASAVLVRGNRLACVGTEEDARAALRRPAEHLHLPDSLVLPGLNDSHIHTDWGGRALRMLNLASVTTPEELREELRRFAAADPQRTWIEGTGLAYEPLIADPAPRRTLDAVVPDRPVYLRGFDWHTVYVNTAALERAGILHGAGLPLPNEVVLGPDGVATGVLRERLAFTLVERCIPAPDDDEQDQILLEAMRYLATLGITSVQNMHGDRQTLERYRRLETRGAQTLRATHYLRVHENMSPDYLADSVAPSHRRCEGWNRVAGIKLFMDGVIESKTAMLLAPYGETAGELGVPDMDPRAHRRWTLQADALGLGVATHAIGDRAVRLTLDHYQAAAQTNGTTGRRHRIEHIEILDPEDLPRFAQWGVTASMQPLHCVPTTIDPYITPYTTLLGPARLPWSFAWRALLEAGAVLAFGSDWPIVSPDPFHALHVALTRTTSQGLPVGGYEPRHCLTLAQALDAYTRAAAYAENQETEKGMLRTGMQADITVFSHDLFRHGTSAVMGTRALLTIVGGRMVYRAAGAEG